MLPFAIMTSCHARMLVSTVADVVFATQFWYCAEASLATWLLMIGGLMTIVVPLVTLMTRKVFSWPVSCLVM